MYDQYKALRIEKANGILRLTFDNPPSNAVNAAMHTDLRTVFKTINADPEVKVVVMTGAGDRAFSAGGDIQAMVDKLGQTLEALEGFQEAQDLIHDILNLKVPMIARINGHAIGLGATLALFSDLSYATEAAKIGDPHVQVGYTAGDGGALIWPQLIGYSRAREFLLLGEPLTGKEAAEIGLITRAVPAGELDALVDSVAQRLASGPTVAINTTKQAINSVLRRQFEGLIELHSHLEFTSFLSEDHGEAARAFLEKRAPKFTGR